MSLFDFSKYRVFTKIAFDKASIIYYLIMVLPAIIYVSVYPNLIIYDNDNNTILYKATIAIIFIEFAYALFIINIITLNKYIFAILFTLFFLIIPIYTIENTIFKVILSLITLAIIMIRFKYADDKSVTRKGQAFAFAFVIFVIAIRMHSEYFAEYKIFVSNSIVVFYNYILSFFA